MSLVAQSVTATGTTAKVTISHQLSALCWIVGQVSVSVQPFRALATAIVDLNGVNLTSTQAGSADAATGPPPIQLYPGDQLNVSWTSVQAGDLCTATAIYTESARADLPSAFGGHAPTVIIPGIG